MSFDYTQKEITKLANENNFTVAGNDSQELNKDKSNDLNILYYES